MHNNGFWAEIQSRLSKNDSGVLVIMVDSSGSGPNAPGAKMAVWSESSAMGTVGGGASEYRLMEMAKAFGNDPEIQTRLVTLNHDASEASGEPSGAICGGTQTFVLLRLDAGDHATVDALAKAEARHRPTRLLITALGMGFQPLDKAQPGATWKRNSDYWMYEETLFIPPVLTIIGGGHVSLALSQIMADLDFKIQVFDDRSGVQTMEKNTFAHHIETLDYASLPDSISLGDESYVVIMTHAHQADEAVLQQFIHLPLTYLGLMGSEKKVAQLRRNLLLEGVTPEQLDRVHMPIGVSIGSQTPHEIAVSIAAEIIGIRRKV